MTSNDCPFTINLLSQLGASQSNNNVRLNNNANNASLSPPSQDIIGNLPASYWSSQVRSMKVPGETEEDLKTFLKIELSLSRLEEYRKHFWAIGAKRPAKPLNWHLANGRQIVIDERMDLHLVAANDGRLFIKPLPRFLLDSNVWKTYLPQPAVTTGANNITLQQPDLAPDIRKCALGFLYTYVCLISYESDFIIANEKRLLPRLDNGSEIQWYDWQKFVTDILAQHDKEKIHWRFRHGELRLSRLNFSVAGNGPFLLRTYAVGGTTVGLATNRLMNSPLFMSVSFGFSVFAIVAPLFVLVLIPVEVIWNLLKDLVLTPRKRNNSGVGP
ncbi:hypothetical protein F4777DRAFT_591690 [Nemania sp. FL0916]|nr:hypothetical protein F4777DRAFT_591690 [Nemania sp. FL0916]